VSGACGKAWSQPIDGQEAVCPSIGRRRATSGGTPPPAVAFPQTTRRPFRYRSIVACRDVFALARRWRQGLDASESSLTVDVNVDGHATNALHDSTVRPPGS
jgi:hypothetical protein